jgi:hypothetical protein
MKNEFTVQQGLEIQARQLQEWESVLKPEVYKALHEYATRENGEAESGSDVKRGVDLSNYIGNYMLGHRF